MEMQLIDRNSIPNYKIWGMMTVGGLKQPAEMRIVMWDDLMQMPVITPESLVRHGSWNGEGDGYADGEIVLDVWYCSECGHCIDEGIDDTALLPKYCPNCGAKMDLDAEE